MLSGGNRFSLEFTGHINTNNNMQAKEQVPAHSKILPPPQIGWVDGLKKHHVTACISDKPCQWEVHYSFTPAAYRPFYSD